jgi:hypothetical protein
MPLLFTGYTLDEPAPGEMVFSDADPIAARGNTDDLGETVTIKLKKGGGLKASKNATAPPQDIRLANQFYEAGRWLAGWQRLDL